MQVVPVAEPVEEVHAQVEAQRAQAVAGIGVADVAVAAAHHRVVVAAALAEARRQVGAGREQVAPLVLGGDLQGRQGGGRQAPVVFAHAGGHRVEQQRRLRGPARFDQQGTVGVADAGYQVLAVDRVTGAIGVPQATLVHQSLQGGHLFGAAAEAHAGHPNLRLRVFLQPCLGLRAQLEVRRLHPLVEGVAEAAVPKPGRGLPHPGLGEGAFDVAAGDVADTIVLELADLLGDVRHHTPVLGLVIEQAVAGTVQGGDEQPLVRVIGVQQHRDAHVRQRRLGLAVAVQVLRIGRVIAHTPVPGRLGNGPHGRPPGLVGLAEDFDEVVPKIAVAISWDLQFPSRDVRPHVDIDGAVVDFQDDARQCTGPDAVFGNLLGPEVVANPLVLEYLADVDVGFVRGAIPGPPGHLRRRREVGDGTHRGGHVVGIHVPQPLGRTLQFVFSIIHALHSRIQHPTAVGTVGRDTKIVPLKLQRPLGVHVGIPPLGQARGELIGGRGGHGAPASGQGEGKQGGRDDAAGKASCHRLRFRLRVPDDARGFTGHMQRTLTCECESMPVPSSGCACAPVLLRPEKAIKLWDEFPES